MTGVQTCARPIYFEGIVQKTAGDGANLTIEVTVFGRRTPVELNANQVELIKK